LNGLYQAHQELRTVERAIERMEKAQSFEIYEENWKIVLVSLEKSWVKAEQYFKELSSRFQPWQGAYEKQRKDLMYLRYLKHARDADTHTVQMMTSVMPGMVLFNPPVPGGCLHIESMVEDAAGNIHYRGGPAVITERKPFPIAVKVKSRGVWYEPPATFRDEFGTHSSPLHLAKGGLKYYSDFLKKAESEFCT